MTTEKEYNKLTDSEKKKEDWMNAKWRPMMGWVYMATCTADFVLFPILWSLLQSISHGQVTSQWQPLTLQGAGLYHIAMGAVLGLAAFGRTQEKLAGANNGGMQPMAQSVTTTYGSPSTGGFGSSNSFGSTPPATGGFDSSSGFGASTVAPSSSWGTTPASKPTTGKAAKFADPNPDSVFDRG
jgi:hypothetical protein